MSSFNSIIDLPFSKSSKHVSIESYIFQFYNRSSRIAKYLDELKRAINFQFYNRSSESDVWKTIMPFLGRTFNSIIDLQEYENREIEIIVDGLSIL